jgi:RNA polymerase sigma-70 factor (ECF subfamily)
MLFSKKTMHLTQQMNDIVSSSASHTEKERTALFNALVLRHKAMIWHICSDYNLGKAWNTEDCIQEVMANIWRDFDKFEGRSSEKTWVWRVATNTMLMLKRKDVRSPQTEPIEMVGEGVKSNEPSDESLQQLQQLINALPEKDGTAIRAFLDGFSYKEIADMTDSSVGAVAMRIARTKLKLKQMYEKENTLSR